MADYTNDYTQLAENSKVLAELSPSAQKDLMKLAGGVLKDGAIDVKTKEMIAVAIAVSIRCEGCILGHVRSAINAGVTMEQLAEVIDVAILMGGGPSTAYGAKALSIAKFLTEKK